MKCFCTETDSELVFHVTEVKPEERDLVLHAWFTEEGSEFIKRYPKASGVDQSWFQNRADVDQVKQNFARLGPEMFSGQSNWQQAFSILVGKFNAHHIEWYCFGSVCEAVRGIPIEPNDLDVIVHTKEFYRVKDIFADAVIEPFVDNQNTWLVRYFGRLCLAGTIIDIVADNKMDAENHPYEKVPYQGTELLVEPFQNRYALEKTRNRPDRLAAMELYRRCNQL